MASQVSHAVPNPKTWRPSPQEWCPRLYIGQHWQDMSIPVYCYLEQTGQGPGVFSDLKWAIRPLGDPLGGKPAWTDLSAPVSTMVSQVTGVNEELKQELMNSMDAILRAEYLAQQRFDVSASVYREEDLRKRAPGSTQPDHQAESSAPSVQQGEESVPSSTAKSKSDLEKRAPGTGPSDHQAGSRASPIKVEEEDYPNTETNTTDIMERERKRKKRGDRQTGIPTAPRPWSYIDNYKRLPPTTAHAPGNVPRPSTGHWASRQMGRSQAMFDSPY